MWQTALAILTMAASPAFLAAQTDPPGRVGRLKTKAGRKDRRRVSASLYTAERAHCI